MANFEEKKWAEYIRQHKNPLVVAGDVCEQISLQEKGLLEYAVALADKLSCPVAATGNTVPAVKKLNDTIKTKKVFLAEMMCYLGAEKWQEPILEERPDLVLLIGYRGKMVQGMAAGLDGIDVAHLGPGEVPAAQLSMGEISLAEWGKNLDALISAL
ncbi:MAG: hypothetical protein GY868_13570 [Deltaproteobacteria bacterium]|nr:hypothetical protein [Deltaproteobacteria bacterium]